MAKKQKAKDKTDLKDNSIDAEADIEEAESLEDEVDSLDEDSDESYNPEEKIKDLEEALLRSRAELDNAFKRNTADIEKAHKYGVERLLNELLPVVDNLEHALNNFSKDSKKTDFQDLRMTVEGILDNWGNRKGDSHNGVPTGFIDLDDKLSGFQKISWPFGLRPHLPKKPP